MVERDETAVDEDYVLDDQVGYVLRLVSQRHSSIFQRLMSEDLTPTQFSTLIRVAENGRISQNRLGRSAAMDVATIKGVVDRLRAKGYISSTPDPADKRRSIITLTEQGNALIARIKADGAVITEETLAPLKPTERKTLLALLKRLT